MSVRHIVLVGLVAATGALASGRVAVVGKTVADFGEYPAGESREAIFRVRNIGKDTLTVVRVRKGCGCATATFGKPRLAPGEETDIRIRVLPYSIFGPYRKTAYVDTSDPRAPHTRLVYGGTARPLITVTPRQFLYVGRVPLQREIRHSFTLTPARGNVAFGEPVVQSSLPLHCSLEQPGGATNAFVLNVSFTATNSGPLQVAVDLPLLNPTNHPPLKLGLAGSLGRELVAVPARLRLPEADGRLLRRVRLRLIGPTLRELDADALRIQAVEGVTHSLAPGPAGNSADLTLSFAPEFVRSLQDGGERELVIVLPDAVSARIRCTAD
jgi:hypothetical protein